MKRLASFLLLLAVVARAERITVLAAASLSDALQEAAPLFEASSGHQVRFAFGGSGLLARQIQEGAPADVFLSADDARMDPLEKAGLLKPGTRRILVSNTLVVVTAARGGPVLSRESDLTAAQVRRIALGDPATVPAGSYARGHLLRLGLWEPLAEKFVACDSVRAALSAVESGNAEAGFVYYTDAHRSNKVRIALELRAPAGPEILYPAAVLRDARAPDAAITFIHWLTGPEAQAVFARYGFQPVTP
ncbi:molybdate ABC transporter substrate-binding protein [Nibricoccus sp. IMCC34717]|uniref:molybdate ABC transporter substrate-binding protein n=1 Tax=Nibricoccus sp. IMCC34717 TaxID=3034021 RepID=UPI00384B4047